MAASMISRFHSTWRHSRLANLEHGGSAAGRKAPYVDVAARRPSELPEEHSVHLRTRISCLLRVMVLVSALGAT